jgi:4-hydroxybenzoate polyprenyltransferase
VGSQLIRRVRALVGLAHPLPSAATVLVALAFMMLLARGAVRLDQVALVAAMLASQQAAISLHNDWCDRALDAVAKPWRAIPSGAVPATGVHAAAWLLAGASLVVSAGISWPEAALDALGISCGFAYNAWLKRTAFSWLPFAVAFPLLPLFGPAAVDGVERVRQLALPAVVAGAPLAIAIHLADTLRDVESDRAFGVRGITHRLGTRRARFACAALFAGGVALLAASYRQIVG